MKSNLTFLVGLFGVLILAPHVLGDRCSLVLSQINGANTNISNTARENKFKQMAADPFSYFRGVDFIWWNDLLLPQSITQCSVAFNWAFSTPRTRTFLTGDQHIANFGAFGNSENIVVFNINDYDEAVIHDFQVDVWRTAASMVIQANINQIAPTDLQSVMDSFSKSYANTLASYVQQPGLIETALFDESHTDGHIAKLIADDLSTLNRSVMLAKYLIDPTNPAPAFDLTKHGLGPVDPQRFAQIEQAWASYGQTLDGSVPWDPKYFAIKASAARLDAGLGSLGVERYFVLIQADSLVNEDDRILDIKAQPLPMWWSAVNDPDKYFTMRNFRTQGERVAVAYKAMDRKVDPFLGWFSLPDGTQFSVRELSPWKDDLDLTDLTSLKNFGNVATQWGAMLATGHARGDFTYNSTIVPWDATAAIVEAIGNQTDAFAEVVFDTANQYYQQLMADYNCFLNRPD